MKDSLQHNLYQIPIKTNLKSLLRALLEGLNSQTDLTNLVHLCRSIAESYLTQRRSALVHICSLNGLTVSDLAYDCIAHVFARDEIGKYYHFENFKNSLFTSLEDTPEPELFLAFKSFILKTAKTQLAKIYAQSDPVGAKIHRNIKDCIKKSRSLKLVDDFCGYVLQPANHDPLDHLVAYPLEEVERELFTRVKGPSNIPDLLEEVAAILIEQTEYRRAIRLIDLVQILRHFYLQFSELDTTVEDPWEFDGLSQLDTEVIQREVRRAVHQKIISTYLLSGKVSKSEAESLSNIMSDIIADWCQEQEIEKSLYWHAQRHLAISEPEYETMWRTKIEYLTRIAREKFAASITKNI